MNKLNKPSKRERMINALVEASKGDFKKASRHLSDQNKVKIYLVDKDGNDINTGKPPVHFPGADVTRIHVTNKNPRPQ